MLYALPMEIRGMILSLSSIPSLLMLSASSTIHYIIVHDHIHERSRSLVRPFVSNTENLFMFMEWTHSVISGSSALCFMIPVWTVDWVPRDLDIYVPGDAREKVVGY